ncbi:hypothetical protein ACKA06_03890 [Rossellomorea oryzaecorticis]|uniref:Uncharacterized protein n=1 Tax=Rossellomorea oryzaecorticis TaxID=1396505 RepID=A0ABW8VKS6_9BACI|nr:hypothetical protein [[Bacillus] enclensis]MBH9965393.1 hypothetical protein [[Bacillus] enclensis]QWC24560.1 hypothetical protein KJK41_09675 [Bacillus haikouensis]
MKELFLVGAEQKADVMKDWEQFKKGVILKFNLQTKTSQKVIEYTSPKDVCADHEASISFTAATLKGNRLYVGTTTEVLVYDVSNFTPIQYMSLPFMNDIHHVSPMKNGNLLVANTGLDMVVELNVSGRVERLWNVLGRAPWHRFDPEVDYRKVATTKPHHSHPNYVFEIENDIWVTRCLQKDAVCLTSPEKHIDIGRQLVHDGIAYKNHIYFTQVDGRVVIVNRNTLKVERIVDLVQISAHKEKIGWCRGIKPLSEDIILVGFTRIRPSSKRNQDGNIEYKGDFGVLPTRLACFNIKKNILLWEKNLEDAGMNAIYSIN